MMFQSKNLKRAMQYLSKSGEKHCLSSIKLGSFSKWRGLVWCGGAVVGKVKSLWQSKRNAVVVTGRSAGSTW